MKLFGLILTFFSFSYGISQTVGSTFSSSNGNNQLIYQSIAQPYALHTQAFGFNNHLHQGQILPQLNPNAMDQIALKVFPNPAREVIHVQFSTDQAIRNLEIRDINGRIILSEPFEHPRKEIVKNINHLHSGIYTIIATSTDGQRTVCKISKVKSIHQP